MKFQTLQKSGSKFPPSTISRLFLLAVTLFALASGPAQAQTFTILHKFGAAPDGANSEGGVILDAAGNIYGAAYRGGPQFIEPCDTGCGTVYKLDASGNQTVLHNFRYTDGAWPLGKLVRDAVGNFYGATQIGGPFGLGTIFKMNAAGIIRTLYAFGSVAGDGNAPTSVLRDASGNLYGTTIAGGAHNAGIIFKIDSAGNETILHSFDSLGTTAMSASLIADAAGNLYGTSSTGGSNGVGAIYKLDPAGNYTELYSFADDADGGFPAAGLNRDSAGNLYGTALRGGSFNGGTAYKLDPAGNLTVLHTFRNRGGDGGLPNSALVRGPDGNFYGMTQSGGDFGHGTVFLLTPNGQERVLHSFDAITDSATPASDPTLDSAGNLYGTVSGFGYDNGLVFKITF